MRDWIAEFESRPGLAWRLQFALPIILWGGSAFAFEANPLVATKWLDRAHTVIRFAGVLVGGAVASGQALFRLTVGPSTSISVFYAEVFFALFIVAIPLYIYRKPRSRNTR